MIFHIFEGKRKALSLSGASWHIIAYNYKRKTEQIGSIVTCVEIISTVVLTKGNPQLTVSYPKQVTPLPKYLSEVECSMQCVLSNFCKECCLK